MLVTFRGQSVKEFLFVRRDWQSVDEQICEGGGWGGFDAILQNQISPHFTISEVGINILSGRVML